MASWQLAILFATNYHDMELAIAVSNHLAPVANALVYLNVTKVHPIWFPYSLAPTLHAARISMIYQTNARKSTTPLSWGTYIVGFLIMVRSNLSCKIYVTKDKWHTVVGWRLNSAFLPRITTTNALLVSSSHQLCLCTYVSDLAISVIP